MFLDDVRKQWNQKIYRKVRLATLNGGETAGWKALAKYSETWRQTYEDRCVNDMREFGVLTETIWRWAHDAPKTYVSATLAFAHDTADHDLARKLMRRAYWAVNTFWKGN